MTVFVGIDIGSATAKAVVIGPDPDGPPPQGEVPTRGGAEDIGLAPASPVTGRVLGLALAPVGYDNEAAGRGVLAEALRAAGLERGTPVQAVTTGYGRHALTGDVDGTTVLEAVTEITCHGRGVSELVPTAGSVIDVGGQDSKAIALGPGGQVLDFVMNDKCAAGTGRFLEVMARALEVPLEEFGHLSLGAGSAAEISNTCTVFAESEVISQRAARRPKEEIIAGIHKAMARRVAGMARRVDLRPDVVMSGGVARNIGLVRAVEAELGLSLVVPELAQYAGALGAALLARERS